MIQATGYVMKHGYDTALQQIAALAPTETFVEAVKAGKAKLIEIDDWVKRWHTGAGGQNLELREYLGFTQELYASWVRYGPDALMCLMG